jgi:putative SOS response-associated peptidase YedK
MIITAANELAAKVHDRMPVVLQLSDFNGWLAGNAGSELRKPAANDYLQT